MRKLLASSAVVCLLALGYGIFVAEVFAAPRKTIAVSEFENKSGWRGRWSIGWGMQEMMATALIDTGRFTVLERQDLSSVMAEQDLGASGRAAEGTAAGIGQLGRAQILISGAVTEFEEKKSGEGAGIGIKGFRIGGSREQAHVAINVRIYDTTTGEVLDSLRVAGSAASGGLKVGYSSRDFGGDLGGFRKTPLGEATQEAINEAVAKIASRLRGVPWQGALIRADESRVYINAGGESGISSGMEFDVYRPGEALIDPATGMNLGSVTEKIGRVRVSTVQDKFSIADVVTGSGMERGDLVKSN